MSFLIDPLFWLGFAIVAMLLAFGEFLRPKVKLKNKGLTLVGAAEANGAWMIEVSSALRIHPSMYAELCAHIEQDYASGYVHHVSALAFATEMPGFWDAAKLTVSSEPFDSLAQLRGMFKDKMIAPQNFWPRFGALYSAQLKAMS